MRILAEGVPIAVVEQETGLSKDVLRKWETRYKYPTPVRNEHGDRIYSREQISRLRTIKRLIDGGHRPAKLFGMNETDLAELDVSAQAAQPPDHRDNTVQDLLEQLRKHPPAKFRSALFRLLQAQGLKNFVQDTMVPLSIAIGESWSRGELRVFEEHLFSDISTGVLRQALEAIDSPEGRPRVLMTTLPGEPHTLGLLMAACLFTLNGAHCIYLGRETPGADIAEAALAHACDIVALSFSGAFPGRQIRPALQGLRQHLKGEISIAAGGAGIFKQPDLEGVYYLKDFASIDAFVTHHRAEKSRK